MISRSCSPSAVGPGRAGRRKRRRPSPIVRLRLRVVIIVMPCPGLPFRRWRGLDWRPDFGAGIERRVLGHNRSRRGFRHDRCRRRNNGRLRRIEFYLVGPAARGMDADRLFERRFHRCYLLRRLWNRTRPDPIGNEQQCDKRATDKDEVSKERHCCLFPCAHDATQTSRAKRDRSKELNAIVIANGLARLQCPRSVIADASSTRPKTGQRHPRVTGTGSSTRSIRRGRGPSRPPAPCPSATAVPR